MCLLKVEEVAGAYPKRWGHGAGRMCGRRGGGGLACETGTKKVRVARKHF